MIGPPVKLHNFLRKKNSSRNIARKPTRFVKLVSMVETLFESTKARVSVVDELVKRVYSSVWW